MSMQVVRTWLLMLQIGLGEIIAMRDSNIILAGLVLSALLSGCDYLAASERAKDCKEILARPEPPPFNCKEHMAKEEIRTKPYEDGSSRGLIVSCASAELYSPHSMWRDCKLEFGGR